uniref:Uncharacterized protein n=1 Tax=Pithovirus LCPAC401 TaxID=2506595 RepID=A0A481Z9J3_9VIRU|nr:MAG: hypothetical protein LCPAC401_01150 [Pithovirus LCPAC401]
MYSQCDIDNFIHEVLIYQEINDIVFKNKMDDSSQVLQMDADYNISFRKQKSMVDQFTEGIKCPVPEDMIIGLVLTKGKYVLIGLDMKALNEVKGDIKIPIYSSGEIYISVLNGKETRNKVKVLRRQRYLYFYSKWNYHGVGMLARTKPGTIY